MVMAFTAFIIDNSYLSYVYSVSLIYNKSVILVVSFVWQALCFYTAKM